MIGTCRLCQKAGVDLQRSHLLSAAVYRILREENGATNPNPIQITPEGSVQSSKQQRAHLLCRACEALLSREGEDWIFRHGMKNDGRFPLVDVLRRYRPSVGTLADHTRLYESNLIPEINAAAITHFAVGIFWKASLYPWNTDKAIPVNLGGQDEAFRQFLLSEAAFPQDTVLTVCVREGGVIDRLSHTPHGTTAPETSIYQFPIPGFSFVLAFGSTFQRGSVSIASCVDWGGRWSQLLPSSNSCFNRRSRRFTARRNGGYRAKLVARFHSNYEIGDVGQFVLHQSAK